jgi:preprotein translocase subunit SecF
MTKVIPFSRFRYIAPVLSVLILVVGLLVTMLVTGVNLGIDFDAGINMRLQVAPISFRVSYAGEGAATVNIKSEVLTLEITEEETAQTFSFPFAETETIGALVQQLSAIEGVSAEAITSADTPTARLFTLNYPYALEAEPVLINQAIGPDEEVLPIDRVRDALASYGSIQIQMIGAAADQEFQVRVAEEEGARDFDQEAAARVSALLQDEFGVGTVLVRQTDYVGARLSQNLAQQTIYLSVLALALILAYVWVRFKLAYAVAAIAALIHDTALMFAFVAVVGMEFSTATIAAILTIIGYSLNDTIVIFDRIRENSGLMRNASIREITDSSISQSLSRTLMTSLTTLLAVTALFIFGSGSIRDFALSVIFGVLVGTYSSLFVASPLYMGWVNIAKKRRRAQDAEKYGTKAVETSKGETEGQELNVTHERQAVEIPEIERKLKGKRKKK